MVCTGMLDIEAMYWHLDVGGRAVRCCCFVACSQLVRAALRPTEATVVMVERRWKHHYQQQRSSSTDGGRRGWAALVVHGNCHRID